jgi:fused signal recognition particle receptor
LDNENAEKEKLDNENIEKEKLDNENIEKEKLGKEQGENAETKNGFFQKMLSGLSKTRQNLLAGVDNVLRNFAPLDEALFEELEETLILSDIGMETAARIISGLRRRVKAEKAADAAAVKNLLIQEITEMLAAEETPESLHGPAVLLIIGVNGVGKTTTIGKLTHLFQSEGKKTLIAAADTFRAAAIDQLDVWRQRNQTEMIRHAENSDPAAVVFDAIQAAKARKADILICDTAGRLQNKKNLMEELKKIFRIISTQYPEARREVYLVLDATTGQNGLRQAQIFKEAAGVTGVILTKLDGTAKGGVVLSIQNELRIPVKYLCAGEDIGDIQPFDPRAFAEALFYE